MNANAALFEVTGKNVFVNLYTNNKEKIIKTSENGKPSGFVNAIIIRMDDIEKARQLTETFKQTLKQCERL
ncbi:hypothetical protein [Runella sp.]|jgi:hypothetical protein|uniref:hypothetical protein n=1 Tax=Runella sp. TaxID=1960881 RepID=UPI0030187578